MNAKTVTLSNGVEMPLIGYGVYQVSPEECEPSPDWASNRVENMHKSLKVCVSLFCG